MDNSTSAAYEASRVAKAAPGYLHGLTGYNAKTSAQFIQVHDAASLPANGAVPKVVFQANASTTNGSFSLDYTGASGRYFQTGIVVANSSTGPTLTIGSADCWFDCQVDD